MLLKSDLDVQQTQACFTQAAQQCDQIHNNVFLHPRLCSTNLPLLSVYLFVYDVAYESIKAGLENPIWFQMNIMPLLHAHSFKAVSYSVNEPTSSPTTKEPRGPICLSIP